MNSSIRKDVEIVETTFVNLGMFMQNIIFKNNSDSYQRDPLIMYQNLELLDYKFNLCELFQKLVLSA